MLKEVASRPCMVQIIALLESCIRIAAHFIKKCYPLSFISAKEIQKVQHSILHACINFSFLIAFLIVVRVEHLKETAAVHDLDLEKIRRCNHCRVPIRSHPNAHCCYTTSWI